MSIVKHDSILYAAQGNSQQVEGRKDSRIQDDNWEMKRHFVILLGLKGFNEGCWPGCCSGHNLGLFRFRPTLTFHVIQNVVTSQFRIQCFEFRYGRTYEEG